MNQVVAFLTIFIASWLKAEQHRFSPINHFKTCLSFFICICFPINHIVICLSLFIVLWSKVEQHNTLPYECCWNLSVTFHCPLVESRAKYTIPYESCWIFSVTFHCPLVESRATYILPLESCWQLSVTFHCPLVKSRAIYTLQLWFMLILVCHFSLLSGKKWRNIYPPPRNGTLDHVQTCLSLFIAFWLKVE